eukprot:scaffold168427_cov60-Cyclotella_meneghiniana.AAC.1
MQASSTQKQPSIMVAVLPANISIISISSEDPDLSADFKPFQDVCLLWGNSFKFSYCIANSAPVSS